VLVESDIVIFSPLGNALIVTIFRVHVLSAPSRMLVRCVAAMTGPVRFGRVIEIAARETTQLPDILTYGMRRTLDKNQTSCRRSLTVIDVNIESRDGNGAYWEADGSVLTKLWSEQSRSNYVWAGGAPIRRPANDRNTRNKRMQAAIC
jgi:hypothetical protein